MTIVEWRCSHATYGQQPWVSLDSVDGRPFVLRRFGTMGSVTCEPVR